MSSLLMVISITEENVGEENIEECGDSLYKAQFWLFHSSENSVLVWIFKLLDMDASSGVMVLLVFQFPAHSICLFLVCYSASQEIGLFISEPGINPVFKILHLLSRGAPLSRTSPVCFANFNETMHC